VGIIELSYFASVVSAVFGGGSLIVSVLPFLQLKGRYANLQKALRGIRSPKDEKAMNIYGNEDDWSELVRWLDRGEVLLGMVQQRVIRRTIVAVVAVVTVVATIPLDVVGVPDVSANARAIEWHDLIAAVAVTIAPRLAFFRDWLLGDVEKKFLENFRDLEEAFYRREVAPKLDLFNAVFRRLFFHVSGSADEELAAVRSQLHELSARVSALSAATTKVGDTPGTESQP
jgi:hypothetical protein